MSDKAVEYPIKIVRFNCPGCDIEHSVYLNNDKFCKHCGVNIEPVRVEIAEKYKSDMNEYRVYINRRNSEFKNNLLELNGLKSDTVLKITAQDLINYIWNTRSSNGEVEVSIYFEEFLEICKR